MFTIPIVSDLTEALDDLPRVLKELPDKQKAARGEILSAVLSLSEAVSQALNIVSVKCGRIVLKKDDLAEFKKELVEAPRLLDDFRLNKVCAVLGNVRAELRTILSMKKLSLRLFYRKRLERLLDHMQKTERDLEDDFDFFLRDLSLRAQTLQPEEVGEIVQYLRDCQLSFEQDVRHIRLFARKVEDEL